jgi:hypothetical protein
MRRRSATSPRAATAPTTAALLTLLVAGACGGRDAAPSRTDSAATSAASAPAALPASPTAPIALPPGAWRTIANDGHTALAVDTSDVVALPSGDARVRLLYAFDAPQPVPVQPGLRYRSIASREETECARATSHPSVAILYDERGRELTRATSSEGRAAPPMIGGLGAALCRYLRGEKKVR